MRKPIPPSALRRRATIAKRLLLLVRSFNFVLAGSVSAVFITLLARRSPASGSPKPEMAVLLSFTAITAVQSLISFFLTVLNLEKLWVAAIDLVCICGYVTTAVLLRGVTASYGCATWLEGGEGHKKAVDDATLMRRAHDEGRECMPLRGVFGVAIVGCFLLLASFQLALYTVRTRKQIEQLNAKIAAKLELGDVNPKLPEKQRRPSTKKSSGAPPPPRKKGEKKSPQRKPSNASDMDRKLPAKPPRAKTRTSDDSERRAFAKEIS